MEELLAKTVVMNGLKIGRVVDVLLGEDGETVVGFEVRCGDGRHRFLPRAAAAERDDAIVINSPFAVLDTDELDFYRARGRTLRTRRESAA
jgi:PRC-barrel domain